MSSVYKQFTAQDFATVPFNAHKQYNLNSSSAASNKITYHNTRWTSESISLYSSASSNAYGLFDPINNIKYNQLDNTFYKNFKLEGSKKIGTFNHKKQKRELYNNATVLSIPSGLYGHEIKPGSFYLSSSNYEIIDDTYGNLIISGGHDTNNYPTDINKNLFRLDPINGYRKYDLSILEGYMIDYGDFFLPIDGEGQVVAGATPQRYRKFWRKGTKNPNSVKTYSNNNSYIFDDSYYFNYLKFSNVRYQTSSLGHVNNRFPVINLQSITGSYIVSPHKELYNFDRDEDFSISFWMEPKKYSLDDIEIGDEVGGGIVFYKDATQALVVYPELYSTSTNFADGLTSNNFEATNLSDNTIGGGAANTTNMAAVNDNGGTFPLAQEISELAKGGYTDWYMPNKAELEQIAISLGKVDNGLFDTSVEKKLQHDLFNNDFIDLGAAALFNGNGVTNQGKRKFLKDQYSQFTTPSRGCHRDVFTVASNLGTNEKLTRYAFISPKQYINVSDNVTTNWSNSHTNNATCFTNDTVAIEGVVNSSIEDSLNGKPNLVFLVRSVDLNVYNNNTYKRHLIVKSGTKSVLNTPLTGQSEPLSTMTEGNMQYKKTNAESQFPYEIYTISQSLYFDRSDGKNIASINCVVTGSDGLITDNYFHIVCQNSASIMQIWFNGDKTAELDTSDLLEVKTRNNANLYIGSKGHVTQNDGIISDKNNNPPPNNRFFNGNIGYVNIFNHHLESSSITPMSESVNNSPYLGNTFYQNGFATITHPNYYDILINPTYGIADGTATNTTGDGMVIGYNFDITGNEGIYNLKFQGSHLMYEHEYQCTVDEHEFNKTTNPSARSKEPNKQHEIANIQTGSLFKPYVTTI